MAKSKVLKIIDDEGNVVLTYNLKSYETVEIFHGNERQVKWPDSMKKLVVEKNKTQINGIGKDALIEKFESKIDQQIGRIRRSCNGKNDPIVRDYEDQGCLYQKMLQKRLNYYRDWKFEVERA